MADKEKNNYNPYEHRTPERPNSNFETGGHIIKGACGTGILALPQAFAFGGWGVSLVFTLFISACAIYSLNLLIRCIYKTAKDNQVPNVTYPECMEKALSRGPNCMRPMAQGSGCFVDICLVAAQCGTCSIYVVFLGENLKQIMDEYVVDWDTRIWMAIIFVSLLLFALIPDLKRLAPLSILGNLLTLIGICMLLYFILSDLPPISEREVNTAISKFPLFVGIVLFCVGPVAVIITVEANMKNPQHLRGLFGVLTISLGLLTVVYVLFGFIGYWKYGDDCEGSITLNLPKNLLANSVRVIYFVAILISHPLNSYTNVDIIWNQHLKSKIQDPKKQLGYEYLVRIINVSFTTLVAIAIPRLGLFIALTGVLTFSLLVFVFPAILDICVQWPDELGRFKWILIKDIILVIFALAGLACGTYVAIRDIVESYQ